MTTLLPTHAALIASLLAPSQITLPRASPAASVGQTVGTTRIEVSYHRPGVKGRMIWGGLVPYAEVWRLGANNATKITFSDPVTIAGEAVPAGSYALFAIPGRETWTFVLNRDAEQWGAFRYDESKDQLRFAATPYAAPYTEWMQFTIDPAGRDVAMVTMRWEHLAVGFPIAVEVGNLVWRELDAARAKAPDDAELDGRVARYAAESGERLEEGLAAAERLVAAEPSHWNLEIQAKLQWALGREDAARATMTRALEVAREKGAPEEFFRTRGGLLASWRGRAGD